jgi:hypothetical protein
MGLAARTRAALTRKSDYRQVFGTPAGCRVLADLYRACGMNKQMHVPGDPFATTFNVGGHRVGQHIQGLLGETNEHVIKRMEEGAAYSEEADA